MRELDIVALTRDIPEKNLKKGDLGAVIHCYHSTGLEGNAAFEVEFVNEKGNTTAQLTLKFEDILLVKPAPTYEV